MAEEDVVEITDPPTFDNIDMYESDGEQVIIRIYETNMPICL